jgi:hypothetical protein
MIEKKRYQIEHNNINIANNDILHFVGFLIIKRELK